MTLPYQLNLLFQTIILQMEIYPESQLEQLRMYIRFI